MVARYGGTAVTDAGRDAATAQLREHYAAGRLSLDQFQDRLDEAYRSPHRAGAGCSDRWPAPRGPGNPLGEAVGQLPSRMSAQRHAHACCPSPDGPPGHRRLALSALTSSVRPEVKLAAILDIARNLSREFEIESVAPKILDSLMQLFPQAERTS